MELEVFEFEGRVAHLMAKDIFALEDGWFYYWPEDTTQVALSSYDLRNLANLLDWLNQPYEDELNRFIEGYTQGVDDQTEAEEILSLLDDDDYQTYFRDEVAHHPV